MAYIRLMDPIRLTEKENGWRDLAKCKNHTSRFFSPYVKDKVIAKSICAKCPVREECLAYALTMPIDDNLAILALRNSVFAGINGEQILVMRALVGESTLHDIAASTLDSGRY